MSFRKSTIWLTQEEMLALDRLAPQRGLTRSALIREGIWRSCSPTTESDR